VDALDALWHLLNFIAPACGLDALSAALAKLFWRRELRAVPWRRLAPAGGSTSLLASIAGLALTGHDGRMGTYGAMLVACALALWWVGFRPGR
jgi:hypothetical protein